MTKDYLTYIFFESNWYGNAMLSYALTTAIFLFVTAIVLASYRLYKGPTAQDRVLALDIMYINAMLVVLTYGIKRGEDIYFDAALLIGLFGFVGTLAMSKFLLRGEVIES